MSLVESSATEAEIDEYSTGSCHILAVALHRKLGWNFELRLDNGDPYWVDEEDGDNFLGSVIHVYALDQDMRAWDVRGVRPYGEITREIEDAHYPMEQGSDELRSEQELASYVGCWSQEGEEPIDRPLNDYTEEEVEKAWELAKRIFASIPEFNGSPALITKKVSPKC